MVKRRNYSANCAVIVIILLSCSAAKSQWYAGASARMLSDAKSFGGSFEIGKEYTFGWLFLQGAFINRQFSYNQTFSSFIETGVVNDFAIGPSAVTLPRETTLSGTALDAGLYQAKTYTAYFPQGPQFVVSGSYCYRLFSWLILGPTIGVAFERQAPVAAAYAVERNTGWITLSSPVFGPETSIAAMPEDYPNPQNGGYNTDDKTIIVGNFGGSIKIALSGSAMSTLLILEYATQAGAGLGVAIPL